MDYTTVVREGCYIAVVFPSYLCCRDIILGPLMVFYGVIINFKHTSTETMDLVPEQVSNGIGPRTAKQELKTKRWNQDRGEDERTRFKSRNAQSDGY